MELNKKMKQTGFTLIELMVTLAVMAILATIAAPSFNNMIQDNRLITSSNELLGGIALSRSEAIKRGERVVICQSSNSSSCGGNSSNWHQGWIIFVDVNTNGSVDSTDTIISVHSALGNNMKLSMNNSVLAYDGDGLAANLSNEVFFTLCDDRGNANKTGLGISITGRARQAETSELGSCS
jgi:type IV fimbrial biogenesis protein FimT